MLFSKFRRATVTEAASRILREKVDRGSGDVVRVLTLPGGRKLNVMREDAYRSALAKAARKQP